MISKTLMYEKYPVVDNDELKSELLVAEKLLDNPLSWGGDYLDLIIGEHSYNFV